MSKKFVVNSKNQLIKNTEYCIFDMEISGLDPENDKILKIEILKIKNFKKIDTFECIIKQEIDIAENILDVTNIKREELNKAETIDKVIPKILEFIGDSVLIFYYYESEYDFLKNNCKKCSYKLKNTYIRLRALATVFFPQLRNFTEPQICKALKIKNNTKSVDIIEKVFKKIVIKGNKLNLKYLDDFNRVYVKYTLLVKDRGDDDKNIILNKVKKILKEELQTISYNTWIKPLEIEKKGNNKIVLIAKSKMQKDALESRLFELLSQTFKKVTNCDYQIEVKIEKSN